MNRGGGNQAGTFQTNARSELGEQISGENLGEAGTKRRAWALEYVAHFLTVMWADIRWQVGGREGLLLLTITDLYLKAKRNVLWLHCLFYFAARYNISELQNCFWSFILIPFTQSQSLMDPHIFPESVVSICLQLSWKQLQSFRVNWTESNMQYKTQLKPWNFPWNSLMRRLLMPTLTVNLLGSALALESSIDVVI